MNVLIQASPCFICAPPSKSHFLHNLYTTRATCENVKLPLKCKELETWIFTEEDLWMEQDARILNWPFLLESWFNPRYGIPDIVSTIFSRKKCDVKLKNQSKSSQLLPSNCEWWVAACPSQEQERGTYPLACSWLFTEITSSLPPVNIHVRCFTTGLRRGNAWDHVEIKNSIEALFPRFVKWLLNLEHVRERSEHLIDK